MWETKGLYVYKGRINVLRYFCSKALIFRLIFMYYQAIESYEHVDYAGLKKEGSKAKMTQNIDPPVVRDSPLLVYIMIPRDPLYDSKKKASILLSLLNLDCHRLLFLNHQINLAKFIQDLYVLAPHFSLHSVAKRWKILAPVLT